MYLINEDCINCGACIDTCPVNAIVQGAERYGITPACVDCGICVDSCPVNAIVPGGEAAPVEGGHKCGGCGGCCGGKR
jgi:NAD-dependent dihydropyrimidine dehydrogenase PreA subunit